MSTAPYTPAVPATSAGKGVAADHAGAPDVVQSADGTKTVIKAADGKTVTTTVEEERYCGIGSILIGVLCFPIGALICLCPIDTRSKVVTKHG